METQSREAQDTKTIKALGSSAALVSICVLISRITGFGRTWAMAFALGQTVLSGSYTLANTLPNLLYELVVGGMIVTAFLPVYLSVKKKLGAAEGNRYASNLFTLVLVFTGIVSILCIAFPAQIMATQNFLNGEADLSLSVFLFQFFAIQIVFYGLSSIFSGLLNANRDYLYSSIAPVANNIIVIVTFFAFAFVAPHNYEAALYIIAIGNPLGVLAQVIIQYPALKRNGIRLTPYINLRDDALRETIQIALPVLIVMLTSFILVSVENAIANVFTPVAGASIIAYARLWFTLPYALLAVPITTTMFTELAEMHSDGDIEGVKRGITAGTKQILFFMIPFALYLMVFATPLISLYQVGSFDEEAILSIASFLTVLSLSLPFYALHTYQQKIFSTIRKVKQFALINIVAACLEVALGVVPALMYMNGIGSFSIEVIAYINLVFYVTNNVLLFIYLKKQLGPLGLKSVLTTSLIALALGAAGAGMGWVALFVLETAIAPLSGSPLQAIMYLVVGGTLSLLTTFGIALKLKIPEAAFLSSLIGRLSARLKR